MTSREDAGNSIDFLVRGYRPEDRPAIRRICHLTGYMGEPSGWYWADEHSFADVWSGWYTNREPESVGVVEIDGRVEGYLLGCRDTRAADPPENIIGRNLLGGRHLLARRGTARFLWRALGDVALDGVRRRLPERDPYDPRWPAHLHIDLMPAARGHGAGRRLMERWLGQLRDAGIPGVHLGTMAENYRGIAFFEAMGFRRHGPNHPLPGIRTRTGGRLHEQLMVQQLG